MSYDGEGAPLLTRTDAPAEGGAAENSPHGDQTEFISKKPWWRLFLSQTWIMANGVVHQSLATILLPAVVRELKPVGAASIVGIVGGVSIVFQFSGVACIYWSDRCNSRLGRRRPFVLLASAIMIVGLLGFMFGAMFEVLFVLLPGYFITLTGIAVGASTMSALLPDICPSSQHGVGSAAMCIHNYVGTAIGFLLTSFDLSTETICGIYGASIIVCSIPTILFAQERVWNLLPERPVIVASKVRVPYGIDFTHTKKKLTSRVKNFFMMIVNFFKSYMFSPTKHPDFLLSLFMTGCWFLGSTGSIYLQYWLADMACVADASSTASTVSLISMGTAFAFSVPFGPVSDKIFGRKPFALLAMVLEAGTYIAFMFIRDLTWIYVLGVASGMGNGLFLSMGYAMSCDTLPSKVSGGKYMALVTVVIITGMTVGQATLGLILGYFAQPESYCSISGSSGSHSLSASYLSSSSSSVEEHYSSLGYIILFSISAFFFMLGFIVILPISTARGKKAQLAEDQNPEGTHSDAT
ncbi:major facilitator superfamily protein [Pelomyxa schiedti]|nr:major facilitator superfamily protein [Pelomyxa schiedti]